MFTEQDWQLFAARGAMDCAERRAAGAVTAGGEPVARARPRALLAEASKRGLGCSLRRVAHHTVGRPGGR